ncbi:MAG: methionine synthase [Lachnospiraceae bacterium]|nr:methionine synthase [Lachnospiraceae bacterium]
MLNKKIIIESINKSESVRYMGYRGNEPDETMKNIIDNVEKELLKVMVPRYIYKCFDLENVDGKVILKGADFDLVGKSIQHHLKDCEKAIVMCATLSYGVDRFIRMSGLRNMSATLAADALATAAIEQVCDEVEKIFMEDFKGYNNTWRFGVGYGDFPLHLQKDLLSLLDAEKRIGVACTDSYILTPSKSVTCIIGLSKKMVNGKSSCNNCNFQNRCSFRSQGKTCTNTSN